MRVRALPVLTVAGASLLLTACYPPFRHHHRPYKAVTSLTCPQTQGELTRKDAAADGKTCDYAGPGGEVVTLQLIALTGADSQAAGRNPGRGRQGRRRQGRRPGGYRPARNPHPRGRQGQ